MAWRAAEGHWRVEFCSLLCGVFLQTDCAYMLCSGCVWPVCSVQSLAASQPTVMAEHCRQEKRTPAVCLYSHLFVLMCRKTHEPRQGCETSVKSVKPVISFSIDLLFYIILLISNNSQRMLAAKTFLFGYWAHETVCSVAWSMNV